MALNAPIVGMASTPDGGGYWLVAKDGGVFAYGDAHFYGSRGGQALNAPIVGMASTPDGGGYWLVARTAASSPTATPTSTDPGGQPLTRPIVGMASTPDGGGYWLVATDGGVFAYGDADFYGSAAASPSTRPSSGWPRRLMAVATGSSPRTAASSPTATPSTTALPSGCRRSSPSSAWLEPRRWRLLVGRNKRRVPALRRRRLPRVLPAANLNGPIVGIALQG